MTAFLKTGDGALAEDMRRVLGLFMDAPGGMIVTEGPDHVVTMMNAAYSAWIGGREVIGRPVREVFPNMVELGFYRLLDEAYATGESRTVQGDRTLVAQPGGRSREAYVNFVLQPIRGADGAVVGIFCQGHEVTRERQAEQDLKQALAASEAMFETSHDLICTVGEDGVLRRVNRRVESMLGYRADEMVGTHSHALLHPDDVQPTRRAAREMATSRNAPSFMNRYRHRDGAYVPISWSCSWSDDRRELFCIGRDMREHVAAEEKLRQAQKMEAIGRLTGGIAHDFNNLLTVVIGAAEALTDQLGDRPDLEPVARMALEAAERGAELVSQLMSVSRTQSLAPQTINCGRFLEALTPILTRTLPKDIAVAVEAGPDALCCLADLTQLTSAMLNLCINARDAMPDGGRLTLRAAAEADEVALTVEDTGEGMSPQVLARALEPFYTTKPEGKGSGLGLAMVCGFAEQSGGRLEIDSQLGQGTRIRLSLPRVQACDEAARGEAAAAAPAAGLRVLLVDDDELVRVEVGRQLAALGCEVQACACGHDALDALASGAPVDLMMTDIHMPGGLNGRQLADHARLLDPALRILFTSGHTEDPVLRTVGHDPRAAFLPKPYRRAELARKLAELHLPRDAAGGGPLAERSEGRVVEGASLRL
jgi:PAS domain S-box-containing protein